jgi:hypothetical protein
MRKSEAAFDVCSSQPTDAPPPGVAAFVRRWSRTRTQRSGTRTRTRLGSLTLTDCASQVSKDQAVYGYAYEYEETAWPRSGRAQRRGPAMTLHARRARAPCAGQRLVKERFLPMRPLAIVLAIALLFVGVACQSGDGAGDSSPAVSKAAKEKSDSSFRNLGKRGESES